MFIQQIFDNFSQKRGMNNKEDNLFWPYFLKYDLRRNMKADSSRYPIYSVWSRISAKQ